MQQEKINWVLVTGQLWTSLNLSSNKMLHLFATWWLHQHLSKMNSFNALRNFVTPSSTSIIRYCLNFGKKMLFFFLFDNFPTSMECWCQSSIIWTPSIACFCYRKCSCLSCIACICHTCFLDGYFGDPKILWQIISS